MDYRSRLRARQHDAAHMEPSETNPTHDCTHLLVPKRDAIVITDDQPLGQLIAELRQTGQFAYDSEFIGELTYRPKLCLIQVATSTQVVLIDPLSDVDLTPFWELLADASVEKIVHAGSQDLEPVVRLLDRPPANVFDTQVAAGFAAMAYPVSLSKLVSELLGVKLGKGLTFTDWGRRPLSHQQLRYAADDVRFLPAVRQELVLRLNQRGHLTYALEESQALCDPSQYRFDPQTDFLRVRGAGTLDGQELNVLKVLTEWREAQAQAMDIPPRAFLRDEVLIDLARRPARNLEKLGRIKGLPRPVEQEHGPTIVELTLRALAEPSRPSGDRPGEPTPTERFQTDALWASMQVMCASAGIDPALVANRQELSELNRRLSAGENIDDLRLMKGWRREVFGLRLVEFLQGQRMVSIRWDQDGPRSV